MERGEFNDLMKDAFKDAEVTPSDNVWTNIELDLEKAAGDDIRRRLFYYKMVAAASVIFALSVGATTLYFLNSSSRFENQQALLRELQSKLPTQNGKATSDEFVAVESAEANQAMNSKEVEETNTNQRAGNQEKMETRNELNNLTDKTPGKIKEEASRNQYSEINGKPSLPPVLSSESGLVQTNTASQNKKSSLVNDGNILAQQNSGELNQSELRVVDGNQFMPQSTAIQTSSVYSLQKKLKPTIFKAEDIEVQPDAGALLLAKLAEQERAIQAEDNKKEKRSERLWTSVGVAAGSFNAVNASVSPTTMANARPGAALYNQNTSTANQQSKASGSTYSVGINIGTKVTKRWIVQGGLNYMTQGSDYTANSVVASADYKSFEIASLNNNSGVARDQASAQVVSTASYQVNNTLQYLNVPLQAGYIVINKKVSVQLNTGVSTDLFLQNTLTPQDGGLDKTTQGSGSDSPYRTINFSGLVGTEISYKLGQHYRLALNPGLRYPFSSIYKSDVGVASSPLTFDVGLRFRYIFH